MNLRLSSYYLETISATAVLKVLRSMAHKPHFPIAFTEADLGAPYKRANSPKPSPYLRVFFKTLSI
jgi:hypothetical protein